MDVDEDDTLGSAFGLGSVLAEVGVDAAALDAFLERTEGKTSRDMEAAMEQAKFMDDVSDDDLPDESPEDKEAREREKDAIKANEERWARRAAAEMAGESGEARRRKRQAERAQKEKDVVANVWPEFKRGTVLKMTEIFYETPAAQMAAAAAQLKKKRRMIEGPSHEQCEWSAARSEGTELMVVMVNVEAPKSRPPTMSFLLPNLPPLASGDPRQANYLTPIGELFDPEWVKEARDRRRKEMTRPPRGVRFDDTVEVLEDKPLDLADWERDIVMCSL